MRQLRQDTQNNNSTITKAKSQLSKLTFNSFLVPLNLVDSTFCYPQFAQTHSCPCKTAGYNVAKLFDN